jgi:hypothetical protein
MASRELSRMWSVPLSMVIFFILLHQEYRDIRKTTLLKTALRDYTYLFLTAMSMKRPPLR